MTADAPQPYSFILQDIWDETGCTCTVGDHPGMRAHFLNCAKWNAVLSARGQIAPPQEVSSTTNLVLKIMAGILLAFVVVMFVAYVVHSLQNANDYNKQTDQHRACLLDKIQGNANPNC